MSPTLNSPAPQASTQLDDGDEVFLGTDMRDARTLAAGLQNDARNVRFTDFVAQTRKGVVKPGWANKLDLVSGRISPWGKLYGGATFTDPNSREWGILAADGYAWRLLPYNQAVAIPLPTGVKLLGPVTFCQAFDNVYCFRGQFLAPLRMQNFDNGFEDLVTHWDSATPVPVGNEVAYGPFQAVTSITRVGNTATVTTPAPHGFITGADITHHGAAQAEYNVRANVTVVDDVTYTFAVSGTPASPATGTITASNMVQYWKAAGTLLTLTSVTSASTTATATKTAHGLPNGARVTIAGAAPPEYNGTYVITVTGADTFTYVFAGSGTTPATGTITARDLDATLAGRAPDTSPNDWTRVWNILPNADNALYVNNRLLVPTAYEPSSADNYATFNGGQYKKKDYLVATDYLDDIHFDFSNEFRINQGSADEIVDLAKFNEQTVVVWKNNSWAVLSNVAFGLTQLTLDFRNLEYGLAARGAWTLAGSDLYFVATKRGVVSVRQTENGKLLGVDLPLSAPIQKLIDRLDWTAAAGIRMANWDSKLYTAVPTNDASQWNRPVLQLSGDGNLDGTFYARQVSPTLYTDGADRTVEFRTADQQWHLIDGGADAYSNTSLMGKWTGVNAGVAPAPIVELLPAAGTQNTILVFDLVAAARGANPYQQQFNSYGWTPRDTGSAMCPVEFFKLHVDNLERLFFLGADGFVNLMEESFAGDEVGLASTANGLMREEIETYQLTRAYLKTDTRLSKPVAGTLVLQTWNPSYTANVVFSGVNKKTGLAANKTRSATRYFRPFDRTAWDSTNANDDHAAPDREDYRAAVSGGGLYLGSGVQVDRFQEAIHALRLNGRQGRSFQIETSNTQGRIKFLGVGITATPGRERKGILT